MKLIFTFALLAFCSSGPAQSPRRVEIFTASQLRSQFAQLAQQAKANGSSGSALGEYGTHALKLNERTVSGGAEIHAHFDDIILVTEGSATLITGGDLLDAHSGSDGESTGSGIRNGIVQVIATGDLVHIPAGTPHQLRIDSGTAYGAIVIKVRE